MHWSPTTVVGGGVADGLLAPTVLSGVTPHMSVSRTEVFGPAAFGEAESW